MSPDELIAHCIEAGEHLRHLHSYVGEPFDRCHGCAQPVTVDPPAGWREHGLCLQADPDVFFPDQGSADAAEAAKAICAGCPVLIDCGAHGILHESDGVWGGMSAPERKAIRRQLGVAVHTPGGRNDEAVIRQQRVHELAAAGLTTSDIAVEVGVTRREVHRILTRAAVAAA